MDNVKIIEYLTNSGIQVEGISDNYIYFKDPSCIFTAVDVALNYAWIIILILTAMTLFGWGILYIKNGFRIESLFKNARSLILILCILGLAKPIVNALYGDNLFGQICETKKVSLSAVNDLLNMREKKLHNKHNVLFEDFDVIDSGIQISGGIQPISLNYHQSGTGENDELNANTFSNVTIFRNQNGDLMQHINGSRSWRNNSPGNIRSSSGLLYGANGIRDGFLVFPDAETGLNAISKLFKGKNYISLTLAGAMQRYAPSADNNNPDRYAKNISKKTGISIAANIKDLSDSDLTKIARAIQEIEGWDVGVENKM